jgi:hypothetical protein
MLALKSIYSKTPGKSLFGFDEVFFLNAFDVLFLLGFVAYYHLPFAFVVIYYLSEVILVSTTKYYFTHQQAKKHHYHLPNFITSMHVMVIAILFMLLMMMATYVILIYEISLLGLAHYTINNQELLMGFGAIMLMQFAEIFKLKKLAAYENIQFSESYFKNLYQTWLYQLGKGLFFIIVVTVLYYFFKQITAAYLVLYFVLMAGSIKMLLGQTIQKHAI